MKNQRSDSMVQVNSVRETLNQCITSGKFTIEDLAKRAGLTFSDVFNFIEKGRSSQMTRAKLMEIIPSLNIQEIKENEELNLGDILNETIKLEEFQRMQGICKLCHTERKLGVIIGNPGVGKTTALNEFTSRYPKEVIIITARQEMSVKDFLSAIGGKLRLTLYGSIFHQVGQIIAELKTRPKTLIIDEAENMITSTIRKGEIIREIFDEAKIGLILCGTYKLKTMLVKGPSNRENLAQLYSRVTYKLEVDTMSEMEVRSILKNYNVSEAAKREFVNVALDPIHGAIRTFVTALQMSLKIAGVGGGEITIDVFREATRYLILED